MLDTLIKHEWKYLGKKTLLLVLVVMAATVIGFISFKGLTTCNENAGTMRIISVITGLITYYGILIAVALGYAILSAIRFYKSVYGDEAYITHTLPVTTRQILVSKMTVHGLCMLLVNLFLMASIFWLLEYIFEEMRIMNSDFFTLPEVAQMLGMSSFKFICIFFVMLIVSSFCNESITFGAIVLGQYWKKHKILGAVVWYVILTFILSVLGSLITTPIMADSMINDIAAANHTLYSVDMMTRTFEFSTVICLVVGAVTYFLADYGLTKKLNLE